LDYILIHFDDEIKIMEEEIDKFLFLEEIPEVEKFLL
jgi:hypothetical protein